MRNVDVLKKRICYDLRRAMLSSLMVYSLSDVLAGLITVATASVLGQFADAVFKLDLSYGMDNIWKLLLCIGLTVFVIPLVETLGEVLMFLNALRHDRMVLSQFLDKKYSEAMKIDEGEVQYYLEDDSIELRCDWILIMEKVISTPFVLIYLLCNALRISVIFTVVVFAISLIKLLVPIATKKLKAKYDRENREYKTIVRAYETEITTKPHVIKLYGLKAAMIGYFDKLYNEYYKNVYCKDVKCTNIAKGITSFLDTFCILVILIVGMLLVANGMITVGAVPAMVGYFSVFGLVISNVDYIIKKTPVFNNDIERMKILYDGMEKEDGNAIGAVSEIKVRNLAFAYEAVEIFNRVSFDIGDGDKIAICGSNGSGKSTLIRLISGLIKDYKGSIKLNGRELNKIVIKSWWSQFAFVEQDIFLFEGSVRDNIKLGNLSATDKEVEAIMQKVGIAQLADCKVTMKQNSLSGGEKQKISIARALLKDTQILFMDEPGNNLDEEGLRWLCNFIKESSKTIIYISHDKQLTSVADAVVNLN